jgi:hypothetical protein
VPIGTRRSASPIGELTCSTANLVQPPDRRKLTPTACSLSLGCDVSLLARACRMR